MARVERMDPIPVPVTGGTGQEAVPYPYRVARWQAVLGTIAAALPERYMAERMLNAAHKRGFHLALPRKWRRA